MCGSRWGQDAAGAWAGWPGPRISTSLMYVSGHVSVLACSFFRLRRRPSNLQSFPVGSLRARPAVRVFSELIRVRLGTAGSSWPPVNSTHPSICGTEGYLKRENRAGKRMNPAVTRIIPHTERCLMLGDFEYVTCSSPVGRTSGVSAFRRGGERFRKVKCPS